MTRWDAALYAANTAHHRRHDEDFLRGISLPAGARVLDLGCGVGDLTARLAELSAGGEVLGVDADPDMVAAAAGRADPPRLRFVAVPAQELDREVPAGSVDAVFSVAMLHWVPAADHPTVLAQVRRALRPGGLFRAEFGGHGQIAATRALLDEESVRAGGRPAAWFFPAAADYRQLLTAAGFRVPEAPAAGVAPAEGSATGAAEGPAARAEESRAGGAAAGWVRLLRQRRSVPDAAALLGWLRSQVFVAYDAVLPAAAVPAFRSRAEDRALAELRRADGTYDQDYVRLDLLATAR